MSDFDEFLSREAIDNGFFGQNMTTVPVINCSRGSGDDFFLCFCGLCFSRLWIRIGFFSRHDFEQTMNLKRELNLYLPQAKMLGIKRSEFDRLFFLCRHCMICLFV